MATLLKHKRTKKHTRRPHAKAHKQRSKKSKRDGAQELELKFKKKLMNIQLAAAQQATEPINQKFDIKSREGVMTLNHDLIQLTFDRRLDGRTLGALAHLLTEHIKIVIGTDIEAELAELKEQAQLLVKSKADTIAAESGFGTPSPTRSAARARPDKVDSQQ